MTTVLITVAGTLVVAGIAAFAALRSKKLDLVGQSEQRRAEELKSGYDSVLAAVDVWWHYRCHAELDELSHKPPFSWEADWPLLKGRAEALFSRGMDSLHSNSAHFDRIGPALLWLSKVVIEGVTPKMTEAMPEDYEQARMMLVKFQRIDDRIDKPVGRRFWKKVFRKHKVKKLEDLTPAELVDRAHALQNLGEIDKLVISNETDEGQEALLHFIRRWDVLPPILADSLAITGGRIAEWGRKGVIDFDTLCSGAAAPCQQAVLDRIAAETRERAHPDRHPT